MPRSSEEDEHVQWRIAIHRSRISIGTAAMTGPFAPLSLKWSGVLDSAFK